MYPIDVTARGAVLLGPDIACDGFRRDRRVRVQTHLHSDHMDGFDSSKGVQDILVSPATFDLLCCERNADLPYRSNLRSVPLGKPYPVGETTVTLFSSQHMLGAVQVLVTQPSGMKIGYSGDFQWPLDYTIKVDGLVIDSTYGNHNSIRNYSQGECEEQFIELIRSITVNHTAHIIAKRGTLERALQLLGGIIDRPLVGSQRVHSYAEIYRQYGYTIDPIYNIRNMNSGSELEDELYVRLYGPGDSTPVDVKDGIVVKLSAYFTRPNDPIVEYSPRTYGVALSDHADFAGTLEYVRETKAQHVITDNSRGGKAIDLAMEIEAQLGIKAIASSNVPTHEWGF